MKVKLFQDIHHIRLEKEINGWLVSNPGIQIKYITQSQTHAILSSRGVTVKMIAIWYERPLH